MKKIMSDRKSFIEHFINYCESMKSCESMKRTNPFADIYDKCNDPANRYDPAYLPTFPRYIDIELTNACNFKCLMCPTGTGLSKRKKGFMTDDIFFLILDQISEYKTPIRFIGWGEPLLHPKLIDYLKECKNRKLLTHLNTNGYFISDDVIDEFIRIPIDSIKFSFQGTDRKSYHEMRNIDFFDKLIQRIKRFHELRGGREKPFLHAATTLTYENKESVQTFRAALSAYVDLLTIGNTALDYIDINHVELPKNDKERLWYLMQRESIDKHHPHCPEVYNVLAINWDGSVSACCADYDNKMSVGNLREKSLLEIWQSKKMNNYRKLLSEFKHETLEVCRNCYDAMGLQRQPPPRYGIKK
jgi:radical SAM protein with 4Fe4S-binding SPASM domain